MWRDELSMVPTKSGSVREKTPAAPITRRQRRGVPEPRI
jgi:hypothetical protein